MIPSKERTRILKIGKPIREQSEERAKLKESDGRKENSDNIDKEKKMISHLSSIRSYKSWTTILLIDGLLFWNSNVHGIQKTSYAGESSIWCRRSRSANLSRNPSTCANL